MLAKAGMQETEVTLATSNNQHESKSKTTHNSKNASNSRNESSSRTAKTVGTPAKAGLLMF
jgi:hypothetical protein